MASVTQLHKATHEVLTAANAGQIEWSADHKALHNISLALVQLESVTVELALELARTKQQLLQAVELARR